MTFEFKPVAASATKSSADKAVIRFPETAMLTLSEVVEKEEGKRPSRMLEFSPKAIQALGLSGAEGGSRKVAIMRAWMDEAETVQGVIIYRLDGEDKNFKFVNEAGNQVNMGAANINLNTGRASSAPIHGVVSEFSTTSETGEEKNFVLAQQYNDLYWRLEEYTPAATTVEQTEGEATATGTTENVGEVAEVTVETANAESTDVEA